MPSNHIYEITEDNNGFLWIGTDNGVSRFDGKRFVNYSTKNGLPSNDVIQIVKEKNGTIWANCYKQPPSYFDDKTNRFVSFENNKIVQKNTGFLLYPTLNPNGGVYFANAAKSMFFKNRKFIEVVENINYIFFNNEPFRVYTKKNIAFKKPIEYIFHSKENKYIGKIFSEDYENVIQSCFDNQVLFFLKKRKIILYTVNSISPFKYDKKELDFSENLKRYTKSDTELTVITHTGKIFVYDVKSYQLKQTISLNKDVNSYYKDKNGTIWITTLNDGLLKFTTSQINTISKFGSMDANFLSIHVNDQNTLFAGNFRGEIVEKSKTKNLLFHSVKEQKYTTWIRSVASFKNKIITVSDMGYCINYSKNNFLFSDAKQLVSLKTGNKLNDSILVLGSNIGLFKLNVFTNKYKAIKSPNERVLFISKINDNSFYFTANSGIYKYDLISKTYTLYFSNSNLKNDNIQCIENSTNGKLWFNTFKGNLFLVKNNKVLFSIVNSDDLPVNSTKLLEIKKQLWIASKDGIFILDWSKLPKYTVRKLSKADGLTSNFVNDIVFKNDSVFAATNNGISIIPSTIENKKNDISPKIISIKINNRIVPIQKSYSLEEDQKNIILEIAGVDLTGHFNKFQYTINNSKIWYDIDGNILNLVLKDGESNIEIRAVDENNYRSKKQLQLKIKVAIPFYKHLLFWIVAAIIASGLTFFYFARQKLEKQKSEYEKQLLLEQQRSKITADLHDDIGATLSSLQINSVVANKLLANNPEEAQKVLEKIENQAENLADKIGDIIWSMKPGKDEFMSMSSRIKNFANDILGATVINYKIEIDTQIDTLITDITMRKNIVLITKEAINNVAKYSKASQMIIAIVMQNNSIKITIFDNGVGFNTASTKGNGIANMEKRALELKGDFKIISDATNGTTITVMVPCH